jgi:hypothetical protein
MEVTISDLRRAYFTKADEELLLLHKSGTLTETAYEALEAELVRREIPVPPRPQSTAAFVERVTPQERIDGIRTLAMTVSPVPAIAVAGPLINAYCPGNWTALALLVLCGPMILFIRGVSVLLYPAGRAIRPRAVILGGVSAALLLAMAPESIRLGLANRSSSPRWIVFAVAGTVAAVAYLWFAYRSWRSREIEHA